MPPLLPGTKPSPLPPAGHSIRLAPRRPLNYAGRQARSSRPRAKVGELAGGGGGQTEPLASPAEARWPPNRAKLARQGERPQKEASTAATSSSQLDYVNKLYLDNSVPVEIYAHEGNTAYLVCRLRAIQQQQQQQQQQQSLQVSWVRNMRILTSGEFTYTSDDRFKPSHVAGSQDWVLEIERVNENDEGAYECQVNSEPKAASVSLYLHVIAASIDIVESPLLQVEEEQPIRLTCRVEFSSRNQEEDVALASGSGRLNWQHYIYWYKDNVSLEYNNPRGGIKVERRENSSVLESALTVDGATSADSGFYQCKLVPELNEVQPAQTQVIVGKLVANFALDSTSCFSSWTPLLFVCAQAVLQLFPALTLRAPASQPP